MVRLLNAETGPSLQRAREPARRGSQGLQGAFPVAPPAPPLVVEEQEERKVKKPGYPPSEERCRGRCREVVSSRYSVCHERGLAVEAACSVGEEWCLCLAQSATRLQRDPGDRHRQEARAAGPQSESETGTDGVVECSLGCSRGGSQSRSPLWRSEMWTVGPRPSCQPSWQ